MTHTLVVEPALPKNLGEIWPLCTQLAQSMAYPSFFCTGDWLEAVASGLAPGSTLLLLQAKEQDRVRAILPLAITANFLGGRDLRFLGRDFYPDPLGIVCAAADRPACVAAMKEYLLNRTDWDRLCLDWLLEDELAAWQLAGTRVTVAPFKMFQGDFDAVMGEFSKKKRYNLRSGVKKFLEAGGEFLTAASRHDRTELLSSLFVLHRCRAVERSLQSSFSGPRVESLHIRLAAASDCARLYGLRLAGQLIAVLYGFEFAGRFFYYQIAHDPEFGNLSPGSVLLSLVMEDCCRKGLKEFNFLQGDEPYKRIWTQESRPLYRCVLTRGTWRATALDHLSRLRSYPKRTLGRLSHGG